MPTTTFALAVTQGATTTSYSVAVSPDSESSFDLTIADSTTDQLVTIAIDKSEMEGLYLYSSKNLTIETNSGAAPQETITLTAGVPMVWYTGCGHANPFAGDVTAMYLTNASGASATVAIRVAQDSTP